MIDVIAALLIVLGLSLVFTKSNWMLEAMSKITGKGRLLLRAISRKIRTRTRGDIEVDSDDVNWRAGD